MVLVAILNVVWVILRCRNKLCSDNSYIPVPNSINLIIASVSLTRKMSSGSMSSSVGELLILRKFTVIGHPSRAPLIKEISWVPLFVIGSNVTQTGQPGER